MPVEHSPPKGREETFYMAPETNDSDKNDALDDRNQISKLNKSSIKENNDEVKFEMLEQTGKFMNELTDIFKGIKNIMTNIEASAEIIRKNNSQTNHNNSNQNNNTGYNIKVDIPMPEFVDEFQNNPVEFLIELKEYFDLKKIPHECFPVIIRRALKGRAKAWYSANSDKWENFCEFESNFKSEFDSIEYRAEKTNEWRNRKFSKKDESFVQYFYYQVKEANYIDPPLTDYSRNYAIVRQLPRKVQETLAAIRLNDTSQIVKALAWLDNTEREFKQNHTQRFGIGGNQYKEQNRYEDRGEKRESIEEGERKNRYEENWRWRERSEQNKRDNARQYEDRGRGDEDKSRQEDWRAENRDRKRQDVDERRRKYYDDRQGQTYEGKRRHDRNERRDEFNKQTNYERRTDYSRNERRGEGNFRTKVAIVTEEEEERYDEEDDTNSDMDKMLDLN
ncbi:U1 small nuclear ribonucleoprotein 70 kDa-like [Leptopilina heterotoma]|uniref:U1 small nuclear ribonucleoprotein 70 kDa-like n=1 Tax=Leptopilina heterotoma TaxID=63436 RepID=UPI001CA849C0|nr:U1 small nuclear ribonucleoprotein 70 kDa-like [Leptopilina heterotoma]